MNKEICRKKERKKERKKTIKKKKERKRLKERKKEKKTERKQNLLNRNVKETEQRPKKMVFGTNRFSKTKDFFFFS